MEYKSQLINKISYAFNADENPVGFIVQIHLYIEHGMDYLIFKNCKNQNKIRKYYHFAKKLDLLYEMELLNQVLYDNIQVLNTLRNKLVHNLELDYEAIRNKKFTEIDGTEVTDLIKYYNIEFDKDDEQRGLIQLISAIRNSTLTPFHYYIISNYQSKDSI